MGRRPASPRPEPALLFAGIPEPQWKFLCLRAYAESDAQAAATVGVSARTVEGWKKRSAAYRAWYSMALSQPRLFATGEPLWRVRTAEFRARTAVDPAAGLAKAGVLYARAEPDRTFEDELRQRRLAAQNPAALPPAVDLEVPGLHRRIADPPHEPMGAERALAEALGVEHAVVVGYWDGRPSLGESSHHERAVHTVREFTPGFRIAPWYPAAVVFTSAGLVVVGDGSESRDERCPVKRRHRCPLTDHRYGSFGACPYWELALAPWLNTDPPDRDVRHPICHVDFAIARLLAYTAAATARRPPDRDWSAHFPVIAVSSDADRVYWEPRVTRWNELIDDPWHRIRMLDWEVLLEAVVGLRLREQLEMEPKATA